MNLKRQVSLLALVIGAFLTACKQSPTQSSARPQVPKAAAGTMPATAMAPISIAPVVQASVPAPQGAKTADRKVTVPLEDVEERRGPFVLTDGLTQQSIAVVLHSKHLPGKSGPDSLTLASLDIVDAAGIVQHRENFPHEVENGEFTETCSVGVQSLSGSMGKGVLVDTACLPSAPLSAGPWEVFGVVKGKLARLSKPLVTEGQWGDFVPGAINHMGKVTQILPDKIRIRVFTGYFFVSVPIAVDWMNGKLGLAQHCYYQTGQGMAEGGCEMPVEDVERHPGDQEMTFVRMFNESNEATGGTPAHVVVKRESKVEVLGAKVRVIWDEGAETVYLSTGEDVWIKVRIDGRVGWIHTDEDLNAIGLYRAG